MLTALISALNSTIIQNPTRHGFDEEQLFVLQIFER